MIFDKIFKKGTTMNLMKMEEMDKCSKFLQKNDYCLKLEYSSDVGWP